MNEQERNQRRQRYLELVLRIQGTRFQIAPASARRLRLGDETPTQRRQLLRQYLRDHQLPNDILLSYLSQNFINNGRSNMAATVSAELVLRWLQRHTSFRRLNTEMMDERGERLANNARITNALTGWLETRLRAGTYDINDIPMEIFDHDHQGAEILRNMLNDIHQDVWNRHLGTSITNTLIEHPGFVAIVWRVDPNDVAVEHAPIDQVVALALDSYPVMMQSYINYFQRDEALRLCLEARESAFLAVVRRTRTRYRTRPPNAIIDFFNHMQLPTTRNIFQALVQEFIDDQAQIVANAEAVHVGYIIDSIRIHSTRVMGRPGVLERH